MGEALEVAKVLVEPTMKLLNMVGGAIGTLYEPKHKRKMADATAYEINSIGEAIRNAADMPVVYDQNGVAINSEDFSRLMQRAGTRLVLQETIKQHNIESVIDNAYEILEKEEQCSEEPVEQGWINRLFDSISDVSDEKLQKLWGKVLAGEIKRPGSFSLRTLEVLKNLSKLEAETFKKVIPLMIFCNRDGYISAERELLTKYGVYYSDILLLDECGLLKDAGIVSTGFYLDSNETRSYYTDKMLMHIICTVQKTIPITIALHKLTVAGCELYNILEHESNEEYLFNWAETIYNKHNSSICIKIYRICSNDGEKIRFESDALKEWK